MDPEEKRIQELKTAELKKREMARFAHDTIRIHNPLDIDFKFLHDGYVNIIKAHAYKDVERFKARLYFKKISQYIIGQMQTKKGEELLQKRKDRGLDEILDHYQENRQIWDKVPRLDNKELLEQIANEVIIGLVEEYGREEVLEEGERELPRPEQSNLEDIVFRGIAQKRVNKDTQPEKPIVKPLQKGTHEQDKSEDK